MNYSIERLIGNTPLVESKVLQTNPKVKLLFKLEGQNPGGSVKDRAAFNMITAALERGEITKDTKLIEAPTNPIVAKAPMNEIGKPIATQMASEGLKKRERTRKTNRSP